MQMGQDYFAYPPQKELTICIFKLLMKWKLIHMYTIPSVYSITYSLTVSLTNLPLTNSLIRIGDWAYIFAPSCGKLF